MIAAEEEQAGALQPAVWGPIVKEIVKAVGIKVAKDVADGVKEKIRGDYVREREAEDWYNDRATKWNEERDRYRG